MKQLSVCVQVVHLDLDMVFFFSTKALYIIDHWLGFVVCVDGNTLYLFYIMLSVTKQAVKVVQHFTLKSKLDVSGQKILLFVLWWSYNCTFQVVC